jgi:hypothetical protein
MNNHEAKLILQAYRPGGQDASDPFFTDALEQARQDPELQKWFAEENVLNARLQARLETALPVPRGLKAELLALRKTIRPTPWWFQPMKLAAAAVIVLSLGAMFLLLPHKPTQLNSFREAMASQSAQVQDHVVYESHDLANIQQWLQSRNLDSHFNLPAALQSGTPQGCKVINWNGHQATMICFFVNGKHMDLFVMDQTGLPNFPQSGTPEFAAADGLMTAMWTDGKKVYLLTGENKEILQEVLQPS